jgi:hypothetical protein
LEGGGASTRVATYIHYLLLYYRFLDIIGGEKCRHVSAIIHYLTIINIIGGKSVVEIKKHMP